MIFMKAGCLAMEGRRPRTRLQIKMAEEETRTRLAEVENQLTQMAAMMVEMKTFIIAAKGSHPTIANPRTANAAEIPIEDTMRSKEPIQENPPKSTPKIVNLEDVRVTKTPKYEEEAKQLAKIEKCLAN